MRPEDVTIIIPTVSEAENQELQECLAACVSNLPGKIIISADNAYRAKRLKLLVRSMKLNSNKISVVNTGVASKRMQMIQAVQQTDTSLVLFLDDHVFLPESFLRLSCPNFDHSDVALCGTDKIVRRRALVSKTFFGKYWERLWNFYGIAYLQRHNWETRATHAMDGGVFVIPARAMPARTSILKEQDFQDAFLNEYIFFNSLGPIDVGDDNFITTWVLEHDQRIELSDVPVETTLGEFPRFIYQCLRWRRTTFQNSSILWHRKLWLRWPWTVWTTYLPSLFNLALFWDFGMLYALKHTRFYANHSHPGLILACFTVWIYFSKVVKLLPHFRAHPAHFFLFFFPIPAHYIFAWSHSLLSIGAILLWFSFAWNGRNLPLEPQSSAKRHTREKRRARGEIHSITVV
ncbi:nucleotide-diphospho-sugar transferase [Trichoderma novae-zelandiae]